MCGGNLNGMYVGIKGCYYVGFIMKLKFYGIFMNLNIKWLGLVLEFFMEVF